MGEHSREVTARVFEPRNGGRLVIQKSTLDGDPEWEVIWRDDAVARRWHDGESPDGEHWFRAYDEGPMELHQYLKYADAVYQIGKLVAVLDGGEPE